ncbi:hypothetical protein OUZ56_028860 [Daphnia magna]|uniref:Uncharacterized protein n=1 Tax=Daphnia magna TaxID=35525 RepID=A0ABR0B571_9CRUS|nr:hypothetical protein OUZ56_028860 [Daphnia magna]
MKIVAIKMGSDGKEKELNKSNIENEWGNKTFFGGFGGAFAVSEAMNRFKRTGCVIRLSYDFSPAITNTQVVRTPAS